MRITKVFTTALLVVSTSSTASLAQSLRDGATPAEFPPSSYTASQYVDSNGCVFIRAGISGNVSWVPRVTRQREVLCGFQPSLSGAQRATASAAPATSAPAPVEITIETPAPTPAAAPVPAAEAPATRVVTATAAPRVTATAPAASTVRVTHPVQTAAPEQTTARVIRPAATVNPSRAPQATQRIMTRAQICEGRTGVQSRYVNRRTGQPIDCGSGAVRTVATPRVVAPTVTTPRVAAGTVIRTTAADICANRSVNGQRYVSRATGLPVRCGAQAQNPNGIVASSTVRTTPATIVPTATPTRMTVAAAPRATAAGTVIRTTAADICANRSAQGQRYISRSTGLPARCGPQTLNPNPILRQGPAPAGATPTYSYGSTVASAGTYSRAGTMVGGTGFAFASNGTPDGFRGVWDDDRLNAQRGLPSGTRVQVTQPANRGFWANLFNPAPRTSTIVTSRQAPAVAAQTTTPQRSTVTTRQAPAPTTQRSAATTAHRYVQVATYGSSDDAQIVAKRLRAQGLPMRIGRYDRGGQTYRIVMVGPFNSASALNSALSTVRSSGFPSATTRR